MKWRQPCKNDLTHFTHSHTRFFLSCKGWQLCQNNVNIFTSLFVAKTSWSIQNTFVHEMLVCFVLNAEESEEDFQKISINDKSAERDLETKVSEERLPTRNNISRPKPRGKLHDVGQSWEGRRWWQICWGYHRNALLVVTPSVLFKLSLEPVPAYELA